VIASAVAVAYNLGLAELHKRVLRIVSERNLEEVAVPIVVDREAAEAVHMVVVHTEVVEVAVPIVVRMGIEVVQVVRMAVEAVHTEVVEVAVPNLGVGLDHKTWIIPSRPIFIISHSTIRGQCAVPYYRRESKPSSYNLRDTSLEFIGRHNTYYVYYVIVFVEYVRSPHVHERIIILWLSFYACRCYNTG
jgi:hypothetical protein